LSDHVTVPEQCEVCGFAWDTIAPDDIIDRLELAAAEWGRTLTTSDRDLTARPEPDTWSPVEYAGHVRDVLLNLRDRIIIGAAEDNPVPKPMHGSLRIELDLYDVAPDVLADEIEMATRLLVTTLTALSDRLERPIFYGWPREATRTLRWVGAQALHEAEHHLADVRRQR
jgi:hypothetical protein